MNRVRRAMLGPDTIGGWRRFLRTAERAARDPLRHAAAFERAANRAGKLQLPPGQWTPASPLVVLIKVAKDRRRIADEGHALGVEIAELGRAGAVILDVAEAAVDAARSRLPYAET